jgi:hypothetical protein
MDKGYSYSDISRLIRAKGCVLQTGEDEFNKREGMSTKKKIEIKLSCNHTISVTYNSFNRKLTTICKECVFKTYKTRNKDLIYTSNESDMFGLIKNNLSNFHVLKTHEGCKADMIVKPLECNEDIWLPVQLKHCNGTGEQFSFHHMNKYDKMAVICMETNTNRLWFFNGTNLKFESLTIGLVNSKYEKHEVTIKRLEKNLKNAYDDNNFMKDTRDNLIIPVCESHQKEHHNRVKREKAFVNNFELEYPTIDGSKWDLKINGKRVQDKCLQMKTKTSMFLLLKGYKLYDNDFYWMNVPNCNKFFMFPEMVLHKMNACPLARRTPSTNCLNDDINVHLTLNILSPKSKSKHFFKYLFDLDNMDFERFSSILNNEM